MSYDDHSAEEALLGAVMLDPRTLDLVELPAAAFFHLRCRASWAAALELNDAGKPVDPVTVSDAAGKELADYLTGIMLGATTAANAEHYAEIIKRQWTTRRVIEAATGLVEKAKDGVEGTDLLGEAIAIFCGMDVEQDGVANPIGKLVRERYRELAKLSDEMTQGKPVVTGYSTGVEALDNLLGGYQPGIVTILCGRPGMGKSALAMTCADANSRAGVGVHVFSLEDTRSAYTDRAIGRESGIAAERLRTVSINRDEFSRLRLASERLIKRKGWIVDDRSGLSAHDIVRSARRERRENNTKVVVVDYLTLLARVKGVSRHESISDDMNILADAAKRDEIAYVVLSQLSRNIEKRDDKIPKLSDLRESGSIEERAKAVVALYREAVYDSQAKANEIQLHVLKNSQGRIGYVDAKWDGPSMRIT